MESAAEKDGVEAPGAKAEEAECGGGETAAVKGETPRWRTWTGRAAGTEWKDAFYEFAGAGDGETAPAPAPAPPVDAGAEDVSWREVELDERRLLAAQKVLEQETEALTEEERAVANELQQESWTKFYGTHAGQFFKPRNYLHVEYPELLPPHCPCKARQLQALEDGTDLAQTSEAATSAVAPNAEEATAVTVESGSEMGGAKARVMMEVGCGNGSTVFPLLALHEERTCCTPVKFYAFDFAPSAIEVVQKHASFDPRTCSAFVCDITQDELPEEIRENSVDVAFLIFVLSAIEPCKMAAAVERVYRALRPGGFVLVRDYGQYDMTQMRFVAKQRRKLEENFYMRADGTRTYFFSLEAATALAEGEGFQIEQQAFDIRELRNRKRKISMYRVWLKAKWVKPLQ